MAEIIVKDARALKAPLSMCLSRCFMGLGHAVIGQWLKGVLFMLSEVLFIVFMALVGGKTLYGFFTLGTKASEHVPNEETGIYELVKGDHSMFNMIYGIAVIIVIALFVGLFVFSILDLKKTNKRISLGQSVKFNFRSLIKAADDKYYVTMLAVPVLGALFFSILPLIFMVLIAFTNYSAPNHLPPASLVDWTGVSSFVRLFAIQEISSTFLEILLWTIVWAITTTAFGFFGGLILALAIEKKEVKLKKMWRFIFLVNFAVPQFVSLLVMRYFLYSFGPVNSFLESAGLAKINFLSDPVISKFVVILVSIWCGIPANMLLLVGVVSNIPEELYEAAQIDGASRMRKLVSITLPYVMFMSVPVLISLFIANFNNFGVIYFLTRGGPTLQGMYYAGKTDLLINWLYNLTINAKQYDIASAIGIIIFIVSAALSLTVYVLSPSSRNEEQFR